MAHNLYQNSDGTYAYAGRQDAWHSLGGSDPNATTMKQLADMSGVSKLKYRLIKSLYELPVEGTDDTMVYEGVGSQLVNQNNKALAAVSDDFQFHQPAEYIAAMDAVLAQVPEWRPETCLALGAGETTIYTLNLGQWSLHGKDGLVDYFAISDTLDAKHALQIGIHTVRIVCQNTQRAFFAGAVQTAIRHASGHRNQFALIVDNLITGHKQARTAIEKFTEYQFTDASIKELYREVFNDDKLLLKDDTNPKAVAIRNRCQELATDAYGNAVRMVREQGLPLDGWVAANGASETIQHTGRSSKTDKQVLARHLMLGTGKPSQQLNRLYELVPAYKVN